MFKVKEIVDEKDWNPLSICSQTPFTQSFEYGEWQKLSGKRVRRFCILEDGKTVSFFQIIFYRLIGKKSYGYIPYGPILSEKNTELILFIKDRLYAIAKEEQAVFIRADFTPDIGGEGATIFTRPKMYSYKGSYFQPRYEWVLSLEKNEQGILAEMHQKNRYCINYALRNKVEVEIISKDLSAYLPDFIKLLNTTSSRNNFALHDETYYRNIINSSKDGLYFVIAKHGGKILAIDLIFNYGDMAMYLYGGSSDENRNLSAPHLALWNAITYSRKLGLKYFNFGGIEDPERKLHKNWEGLSTFKKRFGGHELIHGRYYDVVSSPLWYFIYSLRKLLIHIL